MRYGLYKKTHFGNRAFCQHTAVQSLLITGPYCYNDLVILHVTDYLIKSPEC